MPRKICHRLLTLRSEKNDEFGGDLQKKRKKKEKKGHRLIRRTYAIAFGLNMPPNLTPDK